MSKTFPLIQVTGSHYELGFAIGQKFASKVQADIAELKEFSQSDYPKYLRMLEPYLKGTQQFFPQFVDEITGIADGAQIEFLDCFLLNTREVSDLIDDPHANEADHCTIAVSFNERGAVVGHNEDWEADAIDDLYLLEANVAGKKFFCLTYCGVVPGLAASVNQYGLIQCINELHQEVGEGIPKMILARAVLECESLTDAELLLRNVPRASGFNHVLIQGQQLYNIEIAGSSLAVEKVAAQPYVHTNHYLSPDLQSYEKSHTQSSIERYARAKELTKSNMSTQEMMRLLADQHNTEYPICRPQETIGSLVFAPAENSVFVAYGPPCQSEFVKYQPFKGL